MAPTILWPTLIFQSQLREQARWKLQTILSGEVLSRDGAFVWSGLRKPDFTNEFMRATWQSQRRTYVVSESPSNIALFVDLGKGAIDVNSEASVLKALDDWSSKNTNILPGYRPYRVHASFFKLKSGTRIWHGNYSIGDFDPIKRNIESGGTRSWMASMAFLTDGQMLSVRFSISYPRAVEPGRSNQSPPGRSRFDPPGQS